MNRDYNRRSNICVIVVPEGEDWDYRCIQRSNGRNIPKFGNKIKQT